MDRTDLCRCQCMPHWLESRVTCERMLQVEEQLVVIQQACEGVVSSRPLKQLLHCLLDGGNYLNEATLRAGALGTAEPASHQNNTWGD